MAPDDVLKEIAKLREELAGLRDELRTKKEDQLLTAAQAAEVLGISERAVRQAAWRGTLKSVRAGTRLRFRRGDLVAKAINDK